MNTQEQFCNSMQGRKYLYVMDKFLEETLQEIKSNKERTYERNYYFKYENFSFTIELRNMDKILLYSYIGDDRLVFIWFNRDTKKFHEDNHHFTINGNGMNCINYVPFKFIFEKMREMDRLVIKNNRTELEIAFEKGELEMLGLINNNNEVLTVAEETNLYLQELYLLKRKINQESDLKEEVKLTIVEKLDYLISFFKKNEEFSQEREHNLKRLVKEDLPNLVNNYLKLDDELKKEEEQSFLEAIEMVHEATKDEIKQLTLSSFRKSLTLFRKRYS